LKTKLGCVGALAAALTLCVVAAASAAQKPAGITMHLVEKEQGGNYVDNKPTGHIASPGDIFAFSSTLWTKGNKRAGSLYAHCIVAAGGKSPVLECTGMFALAGGQLALQTTLKEAAKVTHIAIVGGTGAYVGASGEIVSVSRGSNSPYSDDTIHLLPKAASA
jgi:hypothetical protein